MGEIAECELVRMIQERAHVDEVGERGRILEQCPWAMSRGEIDSRQEQTKFIYVAMGSMHVGADFEIAVVSRPFL